MCVFEIVPEERVREQDANKAKEYEEYLLVGLQS